MTPAAIRALIGLLIAPGVPAVVVYVASTIFYTRGEATWSFLIFAGTAYAVAVILGAPINYFLHRNGISGLFPYLASGAVIGLICVALGFAPYLLFIDWKSDFEQSFALLKTAASVAVPAVFSGGVASGIFWLIAIRGVS